MLNAGGLRVTGVLAKREAINDRIVTYDIFSDERDQYGQKTKVVSAIKTGVIVRLNAGIYSLVSTYGDAQRDGAGRCHGGGRQADGGDAQPCGGQGHLQAGATGRWRSHAPIRNGV